MRRPAKAAAVRLMRWSARPYSGSVLLRTPVRDIAALRFFVEQALLRKVKLVAAVGPDSRRVEIAIDRLLVRDRVDGSRFMLTTAHDTTIDAVAYLEAMSGRKRFFEVWL